MFFFLIIIHDTRSFFQNSFEGYNDNLYGNLLMKLNKDYPEKNQKSMNKNQ